MILMSRVRSRRRSSVDDVIDVIQAKSSVPEPARVMYIYILAYLIRDLTSHESPSHLYDQPICSEPKTAPHAASTSPETPTLRSISRINLASSSSGAQPPPPAKKKKIFFLLFFFLVVCFLFAVLL